MRLLSACPRSYSNGSNRRKWLPQTGKHFVGNISPTTQPIATKTPPLRPQCSNGSVGSDEPFKSGQEGQPQQANQSVDQVHSIDERSVAKSSFRRRCLTLSLVCRSKQQIHQIPSKASKMIQIGSTPSKFSHIHAISSKFIQVQLLCVHPSL